MVHKYIFPFVLYYESSLFLLWMLAINDAGFSVGEWEKGSRYHGSSQCNGQVTVLFAEYLPHIVTIQHI